MLSILISSSRVFFKDIFVKDTREMTMKSEMLPSIASDV